MHLHTTNSFLSYQEQRGLAHVALYNIGRPKHLQGYQKCEGLRVSSDWYVHFSSALKLLKVVVQMDTISEPIIDHGCNKSLTKVKGEDK